MVMRVFSGKVHMCDVGHPAGFRDLEGRHLATGDIVALFTGTGASAVSYGLTVVVRDQFTSYSDGTVIEKTEPGECFVMGIKSVDLTLPDEGSEEDDPAASLYWKVWKVKDHTDVIEGEHWKAYGFSFRDAA